MVAIPPSQTSRKNRRRERPGARKRHALALAHEVAEGMDMAGDFNLALPLQQTHHSHAPSRQNGQYERSWKAWKAKEATEREMKMEGEKQIVDNKERMRMEEKEAYTRLFGGEADDDQPREFAISHASLKKSKQRNRVTKPRVVPAVRMRTRLPALGFAMSLPLRPANSAQIEQRQLPAFTAGTTIQPTTSVTTTQSLPTTTPGIPWNNSASAFTLPFHPAPSVSTTDTTSQQQASHTPPTSTELGREEEKKKKIWSLRGDDL